MDSRSSSSPLAAHDSLAGPAAGGAEIGMRRCVGPLRVAQLLRPARSPRSPKGIIRSVSANSGNGSSTSMSLILESVSVNSCQLSASDTASVTGEL